MASPVPEARPLNPREKAHFSLHVSDRIAKHNAASGGRYSSVKYNHKPSQSTPARTATIIPSSPSSSSADPYTLRIQDKDNGGKNGHVYTFTGQKSTAKQSYILIFDPASQSVTLEPFDSAYTFNLATKDGTDVSSSHPHIYPKQKQNGANHDSAGDALFDDTATGLDNTEPDPSNPFDFRHFLQTNKEKSGRGDESEYNVPSSPEHANARAGAGSTRDTPVLGAKKATTSAAAGAARAKPTPSSSQAAPKARKRAEPDALVSKKPSVKKTQATTASKKTETPTVRLDRRASTQSKSHSSQAEPESRTKTKSTASSSAAKKSKTSATTAPKSKIKSADFVHSSDEDSDDELTASSPARTRSPPRSSRHHYQQHSDSDHGSGDEQNACGAGGLEIEVPDAPPASSSARAPLNKKSLASLGLGSSLSTLRSPSAGPISLASATSAANSPEPSFTQSSAAAKRRHDDVEEIDFGDIGGRDSHDDDDDDDEEEDHGRAARRHNDSRNEVDAEGDEDDDGDVPMIDLGPPARDDDEDEAQPDKKTSAPAAAPAAAPAVGLGIADEDEEDPLFKEMMMGFAGGGDSSEESEEE